MILCRRARPFSLRSRIALGLLSLATLPGTAFAAPPAITGIVDVQIPEISEVPQTVVFNLRDTGAITGSAPLRAEVRGMFIDGEPTDILVSSMVETSPGAVCVALTNFQFADPEAVVEMELAVTNLGQQVAGPVRVRITGVAGPTTDPQDPACADPNTSPVANAGADRTVADSDGQPGELVTLDGSGSTDADAGTVLTYAWFNAQGQQIATGVNPSVSLPDGVNVLTLNVTDDSFDTGTNTSSDTVTITVSAANQPPTANGGADRTVADTDEQPGENVTLDGSASTDPDGTISLYEWYRQTGVETEELLGTGPTLNTRLPDGANVIRLQVTDNGGATGSSSFTVTVVAPVPDAAPTAVAGPDQNIADSDSEAGESVTLDGSQSTDPDGTISAYEWFLQGDDTEELLGTGVTLTTRLPDGVNVVRLQVTDDVGNTASDTVQITVAAPPAPTTLAELPGLTPNQQRIATELDRICAQLSQAEGGLTPDQQDLLARCNGLLFDNTEENQREALDELNGEDFSAARTQTMLFMTQQYVGVMDRLMALRGGAEGLSLAGLNIIVDGQPVPVAAIEQMVREMLGGGASADEPGGLLSDRWGLWFRGNYSFGDREATDAAPSFDAKQWALLAGIDYRLSDNAVLGGSLSYGNASVDFNPQGEGSLDTESWAVALYGSLYAAKNFYFDAIVNVAPSDYEARRNITYVDGSGLVTADALGNTDGLTWSGGLSGGYDFAVGGFTLSPNLGVFYIDAQIDGFVEEGAGGLNLVYDEQNFKSLTGNIGIRMTYAWKTSWGVVLPHVRADFVREFEDDVNVFGVRFAADPDAGNAPPILVETDNPDTSYWRFAGGLSAQFRYGISGYVEYQRLESMQFVTFEDVSIGLRMQHAF